MKFYSTTGLPGSGKSTLARQMVRDAEGQLVRVNRDDLRTMLHVDVWSKENEKVTMLARNALCRMILGRGQDVIVDDTGFGGAMDALRRIADEFNAEFVVIDMTDVPLHVCVERNAARIARGERGVPEHVIWDMWEKFVRVR